jgi:hypothetical protein
MADALDRCIRLADASLDRGEVDFEPGSIDGVLGDWQGLDGAPRFAQCTSLRPSPA